MNGLDFLIQVYLVKSNGGNMPEKLMGKLLEISYMICYKDIANISISILMN
jgi:hypothetical protein